LTVTVQKRDSNSKTVTVQKRDSNSKTVTVQKRDSNSKTVTVQMFVDEQFGYLRGRTRFFFIERTCSLMS